MLCQQQSRENLVDPMKSLRAVKECGYATLVDILLKFDAIGDWLVVGCFTAHQLLRSLGPGFDMDAV
jgi:hypothetical protein